MRKIQVLLSLAFLMVFMGVQSAWTQEARAPQTAPPPAEAQFEDMPDYQQAQPGPRPGEPRPPIITDTKINRERMEWLKKNDPSQYRCLDKIQTLRERLREKVEKYNAASAKEKEDMTPGMKDTIGDLFEYREKLQALRLDKFNGEIKKNQKRIQSREKNKKEIIEKYFKDLTGQSDELAWNVPEFEETPPREAPAPPRAVQPSREAPAQPRTAQPPVQPTTRPRQAAPPQGQAQPSQPQQPKAVPPARPVQPAQPGKPAPPPQEAKKPNPPKEGERPAVQAPPRPSPEEIDKQRMAEIEKNAPELYKRIVETRELRTKLDEQAKAFQAAKDSGERRTIAQNMQPLLSRYFDLRTEKMKAQVRQMCDKADHNKKILENRKKHKKEIIDRFFREITGELDFNQW